MFYLYILQSKKSNKFYIGISSNTERRIQEHNSSQVRSTKTGKPWIKIHEESFDNRSEATKRERYLKSLKKRYYIDSMIKHF